MANEGADISLGHRRGFNAQQNAKVLSNNTDEEADTSLGQSDSTQNKIQKY